jgi:hypothetical protein
MSNVMVKSEQFAAAVWAGNLQVVEAMIAAGADVNAPSEEGLQPHFTLPSSSNGRRLSAG